MKFVGGFLLFIFLIIPFQPASANNFSEMTVIISSDEVDSADDIEAAIIKATDGGIHPGTVILDGQDGVFLFTGDDRSLNIFVSNLTLRGVNHAAIENCDDGLFFDDFPLRQILVEGISFLCTGDGVEATGTFQNVTLRENVFWAEKNGIGVNGHSGDWLIAENYIYTDWDAINIAGANEFTITDNFISGYNGIVLLRDSKFQVRQNAIHATYQGILVGQESWDNMVQKTTVYGVNYAGISLEQGVVGNRILANRVRCAPGTYCQTICAVPEVIHSNKVAGNSP